MFRRAFSLLLLLGAGKVQASADRWDHRGALGLIVGSGGEIKSSAGQGLVPDSGGRLLLELGATLGVGGNGNEIKLVGRSALGGDRSTLSPSVLVGYRGFFGGDQLKTFFDLDLGIHLAPIFAVGPRMGCGLQYDLLPTLGIYGGIAGQVGGGAGYRYSGELFLGVQGRTYLFE